MFNDSVSFTGDTRVEVITVLANCGRDTDKARRALVTWIRHKQEKNRSTEHILAKLRDIESKFISDASLHNAFRDARAETFLPRPPDLPLPANLRQRSQSHTIPEQSPTPRRPTSMTSSIAGPSADLMPLATPQSASSHSSGGSSRMSERSHGNHQSKSNPGRPASQPIPVLRTPFRSPPIQIPRALRPGPSSPITSSPEDSGISLRYHHLSDPLDPYQSRSTAPPHLACFPEHPASFHRQYSDPSETSPQMQAQIPCSRPRRSIPRSSGTSSSEESDLRLRYHSISRSVGHVSPGHSRVTPPRTCPPDVPLPPIPSGSQGVDSDDGASNKSLRMEQHPTPVRSYVTQESTPLRPLPIQPIPSPIAGSEEWVHMQEMGSNSLQQSWHNPSGELQLMCEVARQDSPVYQFNENRASRRVTGPPPPYATQLDAQSLFEEAPIGDTLDMAVSLCGGSQDVRREVSKCIQFHRGYEPPYWQTRLQACGLNAEAAKYLVDAMSKQVDWAASFNRVTG